MPVFNPNYVVFIAGLVGAYAMWVWKELGTYLLGDEPVILVLVSLLIYLLIGSAVYYVYKRMVK